MISNSMALSISTLCDGLYCIRFKTRVCMFCSIAAFLNFPVRREERERGAKEGEGEGGGQRRERGKKRGRGSITHIYNSFYCYHYQIDRP